jgi:DNA-binding PadR family transcriptional regulator
MSELNATAAALLSLLSDGPLAGSELDTAAVDRFGWFFTVTRSQIYRELTGLTTDGFVRLGKQGPRSSQQYVITSAGRKRFKAWLTEASSPDRLRSPLVLRVLHAGALSAAQRRALVTSAKKVYTAEHDAAKVAASAATDPYQKAVAEFGVARVKAVLKLLDAIPA